MHDLTLFLITKGRESHVDSLIRSFEDSLAFDFIRIEVVLNGVNKEIEARFLAMQDHFPKRVTLHKFVENSPDLSKFWSIIRAVRTEWIVFPSDDDVINAKFFNKWDEFRTSHHDVGAVGTNLNLIDSSGAAMGIIRKPSYSPDLSAPFSLAKGFSECPFLWPGLIIKTDVLPEFIPSSRFAIDWWIGIYLMLTTKISLHNDVITNYRVHPDQESAKVAFQRKNLESLIHLSALINSPVFVDWVKRHSPSDLLELVMGCHEFPPIYGSPNFSSELYSHINRILDQTFPGSNLAAESNLLNALLHQVLISSKELKFVSETISSEFTFSKKSNLNFLFPDSVCDKIREFATNYSSGSHLDPTVQVSCIHSKKNNVSLHLNCSELQSSEAGLEQVLTLASLWMEDSGVFSRSISPLEYRIIRIFRSLKLRMPRFVKSLAYAIARGRG